MIEVELGIESVHTIFFCILEQIKLLLCVFKKEEVFILDYIILPIY